MTAHLQVEQASLPVSWTGKDAYPTVSFSFITCAGLTVTQLQD